MLQVEPHLRPRLSVVVPCYNEAACLGLLHQRVTAACEAAVGSDYEIVLINDGSRDMSWVVMRGLADQDPHVRCVDLARNYGHQIALTAGLQTCRGSLILVIDADLQDPPELLSPMLARMERENADVVYAQRRARAGETWFKRASAHFFYRVLRRLSDIDIPPDTGDFRLMTRRTLEVFLSMPESFRFVRGMIAWVGLKQVAFSYDREPRHAGTTGYPFMKMIRLTIDAVTSFSVMPLRMAAWLGGFFALGSLALASYAFARWLDGNVVAGWTSLLIVVLFLGASQMIVLGVMGEYMGRLYIEAKRRPLFVIRDLVGGAASLSGDRHRRPNPASDTHCAQALDAGQR